MKNLPNNPIPNIDDSWERTEEALKVLRYSLNGLQATKPDEKKQPKEYAVWFETYREMQKMYTQVHYRRIQINMAK